MAHRKIPDSGSKGEEGSVNLERVGFRPIPLGVSRGKRKKREEKKDIMRELCKFMENYLNLFALVSAI